MAAPDTLKSTMAPYRTAMADYDAAGARAALDQVMAPSATLHLCHPFGDLTGPQAFFDTCLAPLAAALPDMERRDMIIMAGTTPAGQDWVGCMGNYMGTFMAPFLNIPPTGHMVHMRYHEFFRIDAGQIVELQAIWDIPELMMQAGAWPLAPQLGKFLCTPGPMTCDGVTVQGDGSAAMQHVLDMLTDLCKYPVTPDPAVMRLNHYWHPKFNWYGPTGIGTGRGIAGFR
ncbi:MAG: ester cyclase, partial [Pseudomonadota bacterium]